MKVESVLTNKDVPAVIQEAFNECISPDEQLLFVVVGDLSLKAKYEQTALGVTGKGFMVYDPEREEPLKKYAHSDVADAKVKRMYGNARLRVNFKDGTHEDVFRFTYSVATLADMAANFIENIAAGKSVDEEYEVVCATYEKLMNVCPKCGRTLLHPGAECINCQSKGKIAKKLVKYIKPEMKTLVLCLILSALTTAVALAPPYLTGRLVDNVLPEKNREGLGWIVLALFGTYIFQHLIGALRGYLLRCSGDRIVLSLRNDVYKKAQSLPLGFYDKTSTGSVINRISGDTNTLQAFMLRISQEVVVQFFLGVGIIIIMLILNWRLTLLSLIPVPLVVVGAKIFRRKIMPFYRRIWRRWAGVVSVLADSIPNIRVTKSFAGEERTVNKFKSYNQEWLNTDVSAAKIATVFPHIVSFCVTCGSLLIWSVGGNWVINGTGGLTTGLLVSFLSYASMFYGPVNFFAYLSDSYQQALSSAERVFDILDAEDEPDEAKGNCPPIKGRIEFKNVNFSFDRTKKVLSDVNITIEPGEIVGIVGTTGSGKSTLVNLLMRFYDQYEGEILVDGVNTKKIDLQYFRSQIGYVQQDPMMFSDTVYNNIAYGKPDAHVEEVIHAAEVANAHEFIARQPDGYDTMLGERGVGLSGGERQRVSIARAVLKNPALLIFDEATAAVDSETEHLIQEAIERLISGRTTLMIAHRLSTLRKANRIIVVDQGRIIENDTPEALMALKGKYYKLVQIQTMADQLAKSKQEENFE
ncbi:MAG: ABC transporter ATP-binding protein [Clostridia bacterium]|nr:ABC transporter ATP-binding protein [Clostridia bacterium]